MKYWNDMMRRDGFTDGDAYPVGVHVYREQYIHVVNYFADKMGSRYRAVARDPGNIHNRMRVYFAAAEDIEGGSGTVTDDPMLAAINCAYLYNPDQYISVDYDVHPDTVTWHFYVDMDLDLNLDTFMEGNSQ